MKSGTDTVGRVLMAATIFFYFFILVPGGHGVGFLFMCLFDGDVSPVFSSITGMLGVMLGLMSLCIDKAQWFRVLSCGMLYASWAFLYGTFLSDEYDVAEIVKMLEISAYFQFGVWCCAGYSVRSIIVAKKS